ncbi:HAL/PAL/TAL family ammonia-lyase [Thiohalorhabdus sp. Cl-TMA]|uniref:Histidine ammonia-lyase n=1 Tax=Thiohalorhabdus methylotrophus TaxID=3242694 RepID=A0ABV4TSF9_9GAMM
MELRPDSCPTPEDVERLARGEEGLTLHAEARHRVAESHRFVGRLQAENRRIYGLTTGFGPLADTRVAGHQDGRHQKNLIYHLATGTGPALAPPTARAVLATRILSLARGHSGIRPEALDLLVAVLNGHLAPAIPARGTVGASGDLTPLSHLALAVMGEGQMVGPEGPEPADRALEAAGLTPLVPTGRDALALVNGTSAMTGIAALNAAEAARAVELAALLAAVNAEVFGAHAGFLNPGLGQVRPHPGQAWAHRALGALTADSGRLQPDRQPPPPLEGLPEEGAGVLPGQSLPQDPYTIRCAPQLLGAVRDSLDFHAQTVTRELQAVTDNPVFAHEVEEVWHGGNFYGQHVSFASDALANAAIKLAVHGERVVARLTDPVRNNDLPAFLQGDATGLQSGFMGAQVSASALVAEMRSLATPASIQSIPTNADNQDVVTMGTIGARQAADLLGLLFEVQAIQALTLTQAMELTAERTGWADFSTAACDLHRLVRGHAAPLRRDRPLSAEITHLASVLRAPRRRTDILAPIP